MNEEKPRPHKPSKEQITSMQNCYGYVAESLGYDAPETLYGLSDEQISQFYNQTQSFIDNKTQFIDIYNKRLGTSSHMVLVTYENGQPHLSHKRNSGYPVESTTISNLRSIYPKDEYEYRFYSKKF